MSKRFTESNKWQDPWFRKLSPTAKLLWLYLCDQCDVAGFWEIDWERAAFETGCEAKSLKTAMEELGNRYESLGRFIWLPKFVRFQRNFPLNPNVPAHKGIIKILEERQNLSENVKRTLRGQDLLNPYERVSQGLGKGIGKGLVINILENTDNKNTSIRKNTDIRNTYRGSIKKKKINTGYTEDFETYWSIFKDLGRAQAKPLTFEHWCATLKGRDGPTGHEPVAAETIIKAARNYADWCKKEGVERRYIMQASSFVGPKKRGWESYLEPVPDKSEEYDRKLRAWMNGES